MVKKRKSEAQREKRNKTILGIVISILMISSILSIALNGNTENEASLRFNGMDVVETPIGYEVDNKGLVMTFDNFPSYVEIVPTQFEKFSNAAVTFDPNQDEALLPYFERARLSMVLNLQKKDVLLAYGVSSDAIDTSSAYAEYPVYDCYNSNMTVVNLVISNTSGVSQDGSCITVSGTSGIDMLKSKDALIYSYFIE